MAKAKNWAIVVGINAYEHIGQLSYANRDAAALRNFFHEVKFDRVFCFADGLPLSPEPDQKSVQPRHSDLEDFLHDRFTTKTPPLSAGDNCWFFFAGHGKRIQDCDYLLPQDYNPRQLDPTRRAISVNFVREALLKSGADNVILLLDACRVEGDRADGLGIGDEQPGAITIFSCQRNQKAYEIEALEQGAFTAALLEGLRMPGERNCATVERLDLYLRDRVPQLCRTHRKPEQIPTAIVEPRQKSSLILLPQYADSRDIAMLKMEAFKTAQLDNNLDLAEHLWIRVLAVAQGQDSDAIRALQAIAVQKAQLSTASPPREQSSPLQPPPATPSPDRRSTDSQSSPPPVRSPYRREEVRPLTSVPNPDVQFVQTVEPTPKREISWVHLIIFGFLQCVNGMSVTVAFAPSPVPVEFWTLFWIGLGAFVLTSVVCVAWYSWDFIDLFCTIISGLFSMGTAPMAIVLWAGFKFEGRAMGWAYPVAGVCFAILSWYYVRVREELLSPSFNRFHRVVIMSSPFYLGSVGLWLGYWALKVMSGH